MKFEWYDDRWIIRNAMNKFLKIIYFRLKNLINFQIRIINEIFFFNPLIYLFSFVELNIQINFECDKEKYFRKNWQPIFHKIIKNCIILLLVFYFWKIRAPWLFFFVILSPLLDTNSFSWQIFHEQKWMVLGCALALVSFASEWAEFE